MRLPRITSRDTGVNLTKYYNKEDFSVYILLNLYLEGVSVHKPFKSFMLYKTNYVADYIVDIQYGELISRLNQLIYSLGFRKFVPLLDIESFGEQAYENAKRRGS